MMNPKDLWNSKITEALDLLSLPESQQETAEAYIMQGGGEESLRRLVFRDLSSIPSEKFIKLFRELGKKGKKEEGARLFRLLFAIGQCTCYHLVPMDLLTLKQGAIDCDSDKKAAVYGTSIAMSLYALGGYSMKALMLYAEDNPEVLRRAIGYRNNGTANGKIVLLTAYFLAKYKQNWEGNKDGNFQDKQDKKEGFLKKAGKLLGIGNGSQETGNQGMGVQGTGSQRIGNQGMGTQTAEIEIEPEDKPLMKEYEDLIISNLGYLYNGQMPQDDVKEIIEAVNHGRVTEKVLRLAGSRTNISQTMLKLLGGMAFLNYPLSGKLKDAVRVCLAADTNGMLDTMRNVSMGLPADILIHGGNYDRIFEIDSENYLQWTAVKGHKNILAQQLKNNRENYLKVMERVDIEAANGMFAVIKDQEPALYEKILEKKKQDGNNKEREKLISLFTAKILSGDAVKKYLRGEEPVESVYPYIDGISEKFYYGGAKERNLLDGYRRNYKDEEFFRRCQVFMLFKRSGYFFRGDIMDGATINTGKVKRLFENFEGEHLGMPYQLAGLELIYDSLYSPEWKKGFLKGAEEYFTDRLKDKREETIQAFSTAEAFGRFFGLHVMRKEADENKKEILSFSQDSAKVVKGELLDILYGQKSWEEDVKALLAAKKAAERELAVRVLAHWAQDGLEYRDLLSAALEKEKNGKVKQLLESVLKQEGAEGGSGVGGKALTRMDMVKELHKGGAKRSLAWAYQTPFSTVHKKNGEAADEEYLQAVILCYSSTCLRGVSEKAAVLAEELEPAELAVYMNELFDKWLEAGAEAKKRWVLYAASIHGGEEIIGKLQHQIQEWPKQARGAIAAEAVQALSLNPLPQALLIVDGISRKFKFKQIKAAAGKALEFAASQLGISREELADRIVPDMGFDKKGERLFDYGERNFKVAITPALEIEVYDDAGKKLKNMPSPGKRDDEGKAAAAYESFKQMKKQMKMTVNSQKMRLEMALSTGREWSREAWQKLFVENPVMHQFAIGLIWGIYENRELVCSFRYMEDGSFNTAEEEEYELPEKGRIGLVHPIELTEEEKKAWEQQLEDYEIAQPIEQLGRNVYRMTEEEAGKQRLERFGGLVLNDLSLGGKLLNLGWYRGSVEDGGGFYTYYREDAELGIGVELHFSGSFVGGENEDITVYDARFYKAGNIKRGSYVYEEADEEKAIYIRDIPARYFSETVLQLAKATASSQERNENWKEDAR